MANPTANEGATGQEAQCSYNIQGQGQQSGSGQRPPLERKKSTAFVYTPHQEEKLCRKLKFFFMGPHEKVKAKRRCPWKLLIQIVKIILVTAQVFITM